MAFDSHKKSLPEARIPHSDTDGGRPFVAYLSFNLICLSSIRRNFSISFSSSSCTVFSALVPLMSAAHAPAPLLKEFGHSPVNDILGGLWHLCVRSLNPILVPLLSSIWVHCFNLKCFCLCICLFVVCFLWGDSQPQHQQVLYGKLCGIMP